MDNKKFVADLRKRLKARIALCKKYEHMNAVQKSYMAAFEYATTIRTLDSVLTDIEIFEKDALR